jgi:hypothetical protein
MNTGHPEERAGSGEAITALLRRADTLGANASLTEPTRQFWRGYAKGLRDLDAGVGAMLATKDLALQQRTGLSSTAGAALAVCLEPLTGARMDKLLAAESIEITGDGVTHLKVDAVEELENGERALLGLDCEHPVARVDSNDGSSRHGRSDEVFRSMTQRPPGSGIEVSLRIGQHVRHGEYKGQRVTGVIRGLSIDSDRVLQADIALDAPIIIPASAAGDREIRLWSQLVPAHELAPFDDRDDLIAELRLACEGLLSVAESGITSLGALRAAQAVLVKTTGSAA